MLRKIKDKLFYPSNLLRLMKEFHVEDIEIRKAEGQQGLAITKETKEEIPNFPLVHDLRELSQFKWTPEDFVLEKHRIFEILKPLISESLRYLKDFPHTSKLICHIGMYTYHFNETRESQHFPKSDFAELREFMAPIETNPGTDSEVKEKINKILSILEHEPIILHREVVTGFNPEKIERKDLDTLTGGSEAAFRIRRANDNLIGIHKDIIGEIRQVQENQKEMARILQELALGTINLGNSIEDVINDTANEIEGKIKETDPSEQLARKYKELKSVYDQSYKPTIDKWLKRAKNFAIANAAVGATFIAGMAAKHFMG